MTMRGIFLGGLFLVFALSCSEDGATKKSTNLDYLIFGHLDSFCQKCEVLYKINNDKLFNTTTQNKINLNNPSFTKMGDDKYNLVKDIAEHVPNELLNETVEYIGTPFPDKGHTYIEVSFNGEIRHWYVESDNIPQYLAAYVNEVEAAIGKLR